MTLNELAAAARVTRQTAAKRVKKLGLGITVPGQARPMFCNCDLLHLMSKLRMPGQYQGLISVPLATNTAPPFVVSKPRKEKK